MSPHAKNKETLAMLDKRPTNLQRSCPSVWMVCSGHAVFNPRCVILFSEVEDLSSMKSTCTSQSLSQASVSGVIDSNLFWDSMKEPLPQLSRLANRYKDCVTNSDVERSNSIYKLVLSSRRRFPSEPNIKALVFLYFNLKVQCGPQSDRDHDDDDDEIL
ncbi:uncharacterized protein V6R79_019148 [Siganus canaliculatus]